MNYLRGNFFLLAQRLWEITSNQFSLFDEAIRCAHNASLNDWISRNNEERLQPVSASLQSMTFWIYVGLVATSTSVIFFGVRFTSKRCESPPAETDNASEVEDVLPAAKYMKAANELSDACEASMTEQETLL